MASEDCNVKRLLKSLISIENKMVIVGPLGYHYTGRNAENKRENKRKEEIAWTALLSAINSPFLVSSKMKFGSIARDEFGTENKVYDELMRKAFYLKLKGRKTDGLKIEEKAKHLATKKGSHLLVKFLLHLCNNDGKNMDSGEALDFYQNYSNCCPLQYDFQNEQTCSPWINIDEEKERQQRFFNFELPSGMQLKSKDIFQEQPGSHFVENVTNQMPNERENRRKTKPSLFGALTNQYSDISLDMVLSLPEMPQDSANSFMLKSTLVSIDEGFIDDTSIVTSTNGQSFHENPPNNDLQIWTDCLASNWQICHSWERLTRDGNQLERLKFLTESGNDGFDHLCNLRQNEIVYITNEMKQGRLVPKDVLIRHSVNVLNGLPSDAFIFSKAKCCFIVEASVRTHGLSLEATQSLLIKFAEIGTYYRQLNRFTQHHSERLHGFSGGLTLESFVSSLRKYLNLYKFAVLAVQENLSMNFLKLWAIYSELGKQMRFLAEICLCSAAFGRTGKAPRPKFPVGLKLVSYLYDLCKHNKSTLHSSILINLFKDTCIPFLRYISKWIFDGKCHDPYNEFLLDVDDQYLCYQDKHYWTHGYVLKESRKDVVMFDADFIEQIYACGKAINLLKQTNKRHYLLQNDLCPPQIKVTLSASELDKVQSLSEGYIARVNDAKIKERNEKELQMNDILRRRRAEIATEKRKHEEMIQNLNELEAKAMQAIEDKKYIELQRLKKQMEDAIAKRRREKEKQLTEDKEYMKKETELAEKRDEAERKAREELLSYYEELTQQAIARENRALWAIKRYELHEKRKNFIKGEQRRLEEEKSKLKTNEKENLNETEQIINTEKYLIKVSEQKTDGVSIELKTKERGFGACGESEDVDDNKELKIGKEKGGLEEIENDDKSNDSEWKQNNEKTATEGIMAMRKEYISKGNVKDNVDENRIDLKSKEKHENDIKKLIYNEIDVKPNESVKKKDRKLWDIEHVTSYQPITVMKSLLYPGEFDDVIEIPRKSTRGMEPVVKIKELIYHQIMAEKAIADLPVTPWTQNEFSYDFVVEKYQDKYKEMSFEPQPSFLDSFLKKSQFPGTEESDEMDAISDLSLEMILNRSLVVPINAQIKLVQNAAVEYLMDSLQIGMHFDAFRKYLLLEDGEFGLSLCNQIFGKAFENMLTPKEFCKPAILNNIISQALQFSLFADKLELSRQLSFSLKFIPDYFKSTDVNVLDFLQLRYKVPWPCNIIITENCVTKYNKVFSFLVRLKMINWALQKVWYNLKRAGRSQKSVLSSQIRKLQLFRHEMQHFVNNVERYLVNQIIHISWQEFQNDLQNNVHNIDDLHKYHVNYLNRIIFRSLLSKNAAPVLKIITDIFTLILKFHHQLLSSDWENRDNSVEHPYFNSLCSLYNGFKQYAQFLFKVVSKLIRRGYQNHLDHFLLQVNFNGCYEYDIS